MEDEKGGIILHSRTQKQMRKIFSKFTRKEHENFDQDAMVLQQLLSLSLDRLYALEDLQDSETHDRALRFTSSGPLWSS